MSPPEFTHEAVDSTMKAVAQQCGVKVPAVMQLMRYAISGRKVRFGLHGRHSCR
jgi:hypothetical protein